MIFHWNLLPILAGSDTGNSNQFEDLLKLNTTLSAFSLSGLKAPEYSPRLCYTWNYNNWVVFKISWIWTVLIIKVAVALFCLTELSHWNKIKDH
jgi:hypothetical protein